MLKTVAVIGAGTMGAGIAQWFCQQGVKSQLADISEQTLTDAHKKIEASWDKLQEKGKFSPQQVDEFKSLLSTCQTQQIAPDCDLVIEAIVEDLAIKRKLFAQLDQQCGEHTILATNTSSLPIASIAAELPSARQKKLIGLHFFNPAPIMKLVEIILGPYSDEKMGRELYQWFHQCQKKPALCSDAPGFIVNRVARNFYGESLRLTQTQNEKEFKEIDETLKSCGGFRMGPFELMDLIGIDVNYHVTQSVWQSFYNEPRFAPHLLQRQMVESGRHGKKTKRGFYSYE